MELATAKGEFWERTSRSADLILYGIVHLVSVDRLGVCMPWQAQAGRIFIGQRGAVVCNAPQYSIDLGK